MILKDTPKPSSNLFRHSYWLVGLGLLILVGGGLFFPFTNQSTSPDLADHVWCDAETLLQQSKGNPYFQTASYTFENGHTQSEEFARSGKFSCKLDEDNHFGMLYRFKASEPGQVYRVKVWRYSSQKTAGFLVARMKGESAFYQQTDKVSQTEESGWSQLELTFMVPLSYQGEDISVYVYTNGQHITYFDDLSLTALSDKPLRERMLADTTFPHLAIQISPKGLEKLKQKRQEALNRGVLISDNDDWVKGRLIEGAQNIPIKLRLKGDWTDHLKGKKWSFRIQVKDPHSWNRMITFSVQSPQARHFLSEWFYHKIMEQEDVLTTRYDFLHLSLNGESLGVYAYEEHFDKQLIEYKNRREGPIVRYSEEGVWNATRRGTSQHTGGLGMPHEHNPFESADVRPFKEGQVLASPLLREQFKLAQGLMNQYKFGLAAPEDLFDIDQMGKYYALTDLNRAYHGIIWHNQRFYYNPVLSKLEPIGYDGFASTGSLVLDRLYLGAASPQLTGDFQMDQHKRDFQDEALMERYIFYLEKYSQKHFIDRLFAEMESAISAREKLIGQEYPDYAFEDKLHEQGMRIRTTLFPVNEVGIRAYTQEQNPPHKNLQIANFHLLPLIIAGFGPEKATMTYPAESPAFLPAYNKQSLPTYQPIQAPEAAKFVFFRLPGNDSLFYSSISPWPITQYAQSGSEETTPPDPSSNEWYVVEGQEIRFRNGAHQIRETLVIPEGYRVQFPAGCSIDLLSGASLISYSPVEMYGTTESPIHIHSSDQSGKGVAVLKAGGASVLHHVILENLDAPQFAGWNLTGALTFYESDVKIDHCAFIRIHCEDALNLVRSSFSLKNSQINHTFSDGLDIDFCTGKVLNCQFSHTGNDGMDISGSRVEIVNCTVIQAGDKGLSVGEESRVQVSTLRIEQSKTGVAAKDLSELSIESIQLEACEVGFAAYQKKPEFGGARITVSGSNAKQIRHLHLIEKGSVLLLNGKEVETI